MSDLKLTKLDAQTLWPTSFEKQKVHLALNIFNDKTVVALKQRGMDDTAYFVENVVKMWNILNIKSLYTWKHLNDINRMPFTDPCDERLNFLYKMATAFKKMDNGPSGKRVKGLTNDTSNALHMTLVVCAVNRDHLMTS